MICPNCKKEISGGSFCKYCGERIKNNQKGPKDSQDSNTEENSRLKVKNINAGVKKNEKILKIVWLLSCLLVFFVSLFKDDTFQQVSGFSHIMFALLGSFVSVVIPGILVGFVVGIVGLIVKGNLNKGFEVAIITSIVVNFIILSLISEL